MMRIDARLPVRFGPLSSRLVNEAVLSDGVEADGPSARFSVGDGHAAGCLCCLPRSGAAVALAALFRERAVGPAFSGVLAVVGAEGEVAVRAALAGDAVASARFRLTEG